MKKLTDGYVRFRERTFPGHQQLFKELAATQKPHSMVITCADSRVIPELILDSQPGDLFVCRNAGNIVPTYSVGTGGVSAAIEYGVMALGVEHIIVLGHSNCGAMHAVAEPERLKNLPAVASWLRHSEIARQMVARNYPQCTGHEALNALIEENVVAQLDHLRTHPSVASRLASGELSIHGWVYNIESGELRVFDARNGRWIEMSSLGDDGLPDASPAPRLHSPEPIMPRTAAA